MQPQVLYFNSQKINNFQLTMYCDQQGLCFLSINNLPEHNKLINKYLKFYPNSKIEHNSQKTKDYFSWIETYFKNPNNFIVNKYPLHLLGTNFQKLIWSQLLTIPNNTFITYQELANQVNMPTAVRAVASAVAKNNILIIIPCHRIVNKNPKIINYSAGIDKKIFLQTHEQKDIII